jgi:hypothetical protein
MTKWEAETAQSFIIVWEAETAQSYFYTRRDADGLFITTVTTWTSIFQSMSTEHRGQMAEVRGQRAEAQSTELLRANEELKLTLDWMASP